MDKQLREYMAHWCEFYGLTADDKHEILTLCDQMLTKMRQKARRQIKQNWKQLRRE